MKKFLVILVLSIFLLLSNFSSSLAWYGVGNSPNWPHAYDGLSSKVLSPLYASPSDYYLVGETITIHFEIINPLENNTSINKTIYLKIAKVLESPIGIDITSGLPIRSELDLYENNRAGNDIQNLITALDLGTLVLSPGETSTFSKSFTLSETGYYQFDLTDQSADEGYLPGHIYTAGFVRFLDSPSTNNSGSSNSSNSSGNSSDATNASVLSVGTSLARRVFAPLQIDNGESEIEQTPIPEGEILGETTQTVVSNLCVNCIWWQPLVGTLLVGFLFTFFTKRKMRRPSIILTNLIIMHTGYLIFLVLNTSCRNIVVITSESWQCRYFFFILLISMFFSLVSGEKLSHHVWGQKKEV